MKTTHDKKFFYIFQNIERMLEPLHEIYLALEIFLLEQLLKLTFKKLMNLFYMYSYKFTKEENSSPINFLTNSTIC